MIFFIKRGSLFGQLSRTWSPIVLILVSKLHFYLIFVTTKYIFKKIFIF
jgi:hypothetical protein